MNKMYIVALWASLVGVASLYSADARHKIMAGQKAVAVVAIKQALPDSGCHELDEYVGLIETYFKNEKMSTKESVRLSLLEAHLRAHNIVHPFARHRYAMTVDSARGAQLPLGDEGLRYLSLE